MTFTVSLWLGLHTDPPEMREWDVTHQDLPAMNIAVLADFHFSDPEDLQNLAHIRRQMIGRDLDLVFFAGDFIGSTDLYRDVSRKQIVTALEALALPTLSFAVLGNHDNWDSRTEWINAFSQSSIDLIENRIAVITVNDVKVCIRGVGDTYSGHSLDVQIPLSCNEKVITLTHDPAGLIDANGEIGSVSFAGHTHCGQIAFPFIGAPIVPTNAPKQLHCGRFDLGYPGIVSGGLGSSIIPIRFGPRTQPGWELIRIQSLSEASDSR